MRHKIDFIAGDDPYILEAGDLSTTGYAVSSAEYYVGVYHELPGASRINFIEFSAYIPNNIHIYLYGKDASNQYVLVNYHDSATYNATMDPATFANVTNPYRIQILDNNENIHRVRVQITGYPTPTTVDYCLVDYEPMDDAAFAHSASELEDDSCDMGIHVYEPTTINPFVVRTGEKREQVTDLSLVTAAGTLDFIRSYRQGKLTDPAFPRVMGLGWSHNHNLFLDATSSSVLYVYLEGGGRAHFTQDPLISTRYPAKAGGTSVVIVDSSSTNARYRLEATNQTFSFNTAGQLKERRWSNGEVWTYTYYSSGYAAGKLEKVADGYGRELRFSYINHSGFFDHLQLWRVGDQTAANLDTGTPSGRYVEYGYTLSPLTANAPLLTSVKDVRGFTWTYTYEASDPNKANWLLRHTSPLVDIDGNGTTDGQIVLEENAYTLSSGSLTAITQERGKFQQTSPAVTNPALLSTNYTFQQTAPVHRSTTETTSGRTKTHHFLGGVYRGTEDPAGAQSKQYLRSDYRPFSIQDANGQATELEWSADGKRLTRVSGALNQTTDLAYDSQNRLISLVSADGLKTIYSYDDTRRVPALVMTTGTTTEIDINGSMEENRGWTGFGSVTHGRSTVQVETGTYSWHVNATAASSGIFSGTWPQQANTTYVFRARVYLVSGQVRMRATSPYSYFEVLSSTALNSWQTLEITFPAPYNVVQQIAFDNPNGSAEFYVDDVTVISFPTARKTYELPLNGSMEAKRGWRSVGTVTHSQSNAQVDTGAFAWHVNAASAAGIESLPWTQRANTAYVFLARVYLISGRVKMRTADGSVSVLSSTTSNSWQTLRMIYPATSAVTQRVQFLADGGAAQFYVDNVVVAPFLTAQQMTYDAKDRQTAEERLDPATGTVFQSRVQTYYTTGDGNGLLWTVEQNDIGGTNDVSTTYTYDSAGRVKKVQQTSNFGSCETQFTLYDAAGNVLASVCNYDQGASAEPTTVAAVRALYNASTPEKNIITTHEYDSLGRRVKTVTYDNATGVGSQTQLTFYDALSRVTRTVQNYVPQGTSAPGKWVFEAGVWKQTAGGTVIAHGAEKNQNIITDMAYNSRGLVRSQRDVLGQIVLFGYDASDRLIKTVQNASQSTYNNDYVGTLPDPDLSDYVPNSAADQDLITSQVYDAVGNVVQTTDVRGVSSFTVYDALYRPTRVVQNAKAAATIALNPGDVGYAIANDPRRIIGYTVSSDPDRDQITDTIYDVMGRVMETRRLLETRGSEQWDITRYTYDDQGRPRLTIEHYQAQGTTNPKNWSWDSVNKWWDNGASGFVAHTSDYYVFAGNEDVNLITETLYDSQGRVEAQRDSYGRLTRQVYDGLGRVKRTIANYVPQGSTDPANWVFESGVWKQAPGGAVVDRGTKLDQNQITDTIYDADGHVAANRDAAGRLSARGYDAVGRPVISVQNFIDAFTPYEPFYNWVWESNNWKDKTGGVTIQRGTGFDQNVISGTSYDPRGRVLYTRNALGQVTRHVYDAVGRLVRTIQNYVDQGGSDPATWVWDAGQLRWEQSNGTAIDHGTANDQNLISDTAYDVAGRVETTRDSAGRLNRMVYDKAGRTVVQVMNYTLASDPAAWVWDAVDKRWENATVAIDQGTARDRNLISTTEYNKAGQVMKTRDVRGTQTEMIYDAAGRTHQIIGAADIVSLATTSYTNYDKAGRVLRRIATYVPQVGVSPDAYDGTTWTFNPATHGTDNDQNRITVYTYDKASRVILVTDPLNISTKTFYRRDGLVDYNVDPTGSKTVYRYDGLGRRWRVVQNNINGDATGLSWNPTLQLWINPSGYGVHTTGTGINYDKDIIVDVTYDASGQVSSLRNPRGQLTTYTYDALGRRTSLTNPLNQTWLTAFTEANGTTQTIQTMPGLSTGGAYTITHDFDRLGRVVSRQHGSPTTTPDIKLAYSLAGDRTQMAEFGGANFTSKVRQTNFTYDAQHRLASAAFDNDGNGTVDETVSYVYDAGGNRTLMTLPGSRTVAYVYDARGRLTQMTHWGSQVTTWTYDAADHPVTMTRPNLYNTRYTHDVGSRLTRLREQRNGVLKGLFEYTLDSRGNRARAKEWIVTNVAAQITTYSYNSFALVQKEAWTDAAPYKTTTSQTNALTLTIPGTTAQLTYGKGPDHGKFDIYIDGVFNQTVDGYAASTADATLTLSPDISDSHVLEIRNTATKHASSTGYKVRFKQWAITSQTYKAQDITYTYDALSRLTAATYADGARSYAYLFDLAGNRIREQVTIGITTTTSNWTYNAANQMATQQIGSNPVINFTYDANGNMTSDGVLTYAWNRANRLTTVTSGGINTNYTYDGDNNRRSQSVGGMLTRYLLDVQPSLALVLTDIATTAANTVDYVHGPMGVQNMQKNAVWYTPLTDGLGSERSELTTTGTIQASKHYDPFGQPYDALGTWIGTFGYAGEQIDSTGLSYNRARYYKPNLGAWTALDPFEGVMDRVMSLNGYEYVEGNPVNNGDPSGKQPCTQSISGLQKPYLLPNGCYIDLAELGWNEQEALEFYYHMNTDPEEKRIINTANQLIGEAIWPYFHNGGYRLNSEASMREGWKNFFILLSLGLAAPLVVAGVSSGAASLMSLPLTAKLGLLGAGSAFVGTATHQAINNMNTCGMDIFNAFALKNLNTQQLAENTLTGLFTGLTAGLWAWLGRSAVIGSTSFITAYGAGTILTNMGKGKSGVALLEGITPLGLASNALVGGILGSIPPLLTTSPAVGIVEPLVHLQIGVITSGLVALLNYGVTKDKPQGPETGVAPLSGGTEMFNPMFSSHPAVQFVVNVVTALGYTFVSIKIEFAK